MRKIKFRYWDDLNNIMVYDVERSGQFGFYLKNYKCMQYIGLKDKNSKEIYEGDIVECRALGHKNIVLVKDIREIPIQIKGWDSLYSESYYREIIGNIYKNPELLKNVSQNDG